VTKGELVKILSSPDLPDDTEIYIRGGIPWDDDCFTADVRAFKDNGDGKTVVYFVIDEHPDHRNWPEKSRGVEEIGI